MVNEPQPSDNLPATPPPPERRAATLWDQMEREFDEMRRRMADMLRRPGIGPFARGTSGEATVWAPTADAFEANGALVVKAELPGVKKEDITVTAEQGMLTIEGRRHEERETKNARYHALERFSGDFRRSFPLPDGVDTEAITADFKDGVLDVRVPLPEEPHRQPTKIEVKG